MELFRNNFLRRLLFLVWVPAYASEFVLLVLDAKA